MYIDIHFFHFNSCKIIKLILQEKQNIFIFVPGDSFEPELIFNIDVLYFEIYTDKRLL